MKIKQSDYELLKTHVEGSRVYPMLLEYREAGLSDMRYRWDCLYSSGLTIGDGVGMPGDIDLYAYMDDTHIDTALRKITGTK
jgi:hypothetical protein